MKTLRRHLILSPLYGVALFLCLVACNKELAETDPSGLEQDTSTSTFSIGYARRVRFAPGNLAVQGRTFVNNQWEYGGYFCWGTGNRPELNSLDNSEYPTFYDWGDYLYYAEAGWRTLKKSEWEYLLEYRKDAEFKRGLGTVAGIHGLILLPDNWLAPDGVTVSSGCISWNDNVFSPTQWDKMKKAGAAFLPASDHIWEGNTIDGVVIDPGPHLGEVGYYWSATPCGSDKAYYVCFYDGLVYAADIQQRSYLISVRLVRDAN